MRARRRSARLRLLAVTASIPLLLAAVRAPRSRTASPSSTSARSSCRAATRRRCSPAYGIALSKGSPLPAQVDDALAGLIADGTVARLQRKWLTTNLAGLPVLR